MWMPGSDDDDAGPAASPRGPFPDGVSPRPSRLRFAIRSTVIDGATVPVRESRTLAKPFCNLLHFAPAADRAGPRLLIVAPLAGQHAVLLRDMVVALLPDHDVYLTDWIDARRVPPALGAFGFDDNVAYVVEFVRRLGPDVHLIGLCQSAVPALAAAALFGAGEPSAAPRSLTLIAGPIDPRQRPTRVERLLAARPIAWFERNVIGTVPAPYAGAGRRVYPGAIQLRGLMAYLARHLACRLELYDKLLHDDGAEPRQHPFYELFANVMDLPAEFFLETVWRVFQDFALPRGRLDWRGQPIAPAAISRTALMTVEGERDDIAGLGQTGAAHDLCVSIPSHRRRHHLEPEVGHFGTFYGRRWRRRIMPEIRDFIRRVG
jgi:poly(3-hydroxybutyrate) depolymerase